MKGNGIERKERLTPVQQLQERPTEFLIVGIGASAGGIQALQQFFRHVPEDSGMAYVVILHLSPDHDSELAGVLQRETTVPVAQVTEKTAIKPNHIYVVPPDRHLTMEEGYITVSPNLLIEERRAPVDIFFRTLADQHGPRAIAVILSGTGANGSMGMKRIKERGGATFVQNPREAEFNEMPRNSIATDLVDEVLNVADIPAKIVAYKTSIGTVQIIEEASQQPEEQQQALREIFTLLRQRTGHDFSNYKRPTLLRRIERRINVHALPTLPAYAKFLKESEEEATALLKDLLISVTNFFRDKKSFEVVEQEIIPAILKGKESEEQIRVWVAGCATGEEAYSLAMLCLEKTAGLIDGPTLQIFATDIDEAAIAQARDGIYTINDLADVSPERLRRFFTKEGESYRVKREVREIVIFALHNFLKDPPFSRLDLVSCRNVMIYLNSVAQERVIETFHFALNRGAFLFFGNSESVDGASDLFATFHREHHIFQSRQVGLRSYPVPQTLPSVYFEKQKEAPSPQQRAKPFERTSFGDLHQGLLEEYAPPSIVVNEEYDIVHLTGKAGAYLQIGGGEISNNLLKLVRPELRIELRSALYQAVQRQLPVATKGVKLTTNGHAETVNIHVRPVLKPGDAARGFILVLFEPASEEGSPKVALASDEPMARQLEEELAQMRTQLRSSNEQHEFQAEELKATNEELQAMNEELRSAAEELETSKEELQSINEELRTVNQELKVKIEETSIASNNLQNLINSTDIGTVFLDRNFRVVLFTPAAREIFNLRMADYGRPLSDITSNLDYNNLLQDAGQVLTRLVELEKEVSTKGGGFYLMRITPYRTDEDRIKGVVVTFLDITERKKIEAAFRIGEQRLQRMVNIPKVGVLTFDKSGAIVHANDAFLQMVTYKRQEFESRDFSWRDFTPPEHIEASEQIWAQLLDTGRGGPYEKEYYRKDGSRIWMMFVAADLGDGTIVEYAVDVSDRRVAEEALRLLSEQLEGQVKERTASLLITTDQLQRNLAILQQAEDLAQIGSWEYHFATESFTWSEGMYRLFGLPSGTVVQPEIYIQSAIPEEKELAAQVANRIREGILPLLETISIKAVDSTKVLKIEAAVVRDAEGVPVRVIGVDLDITGVRQAAKTLSEQAHFIQSTNEALPDILNVMNIEAKEIVYVNHSFEERLGYTEEQIQSMAPPFFGIVYEEDVAGVTTHLEALKEAPDGALREMEYRLKAADGTLRWFRSRDAVFRRNKEGGVVEKIGIAQDITERKKVEQELKESNVSLRHANENLQQFASIASHDLQEPLRKIKLFTSVIERNWTDLLPAEGKDVIHKITIASDRMSQLIREVLQYSRIAYGEKEFIVTDLHRVLQDVLSDLALLLEDAGAAIDYPEPLPLIDAIALQIHQVFYNLLINAVKFKTKGKSLYVRIFAGPVSTKTLKNFPDLMQDKSYIEIVFSDNGIGFEQEYADQVFQIFERLHSVDEYEGTGVGLALCKKIVENHSGHIYAISGDGQGAAFHILLPVRQ